MKSGKKIIIPIIFLKIKDKGYHLMVKGMIQNVTMNLLIDTGASQTVFDTHCIRNIMGGLQARVYDNQFTGLGTQEITTHVSWIEHFFLDTLQIEPNDYPLIDLTEINKVYAKLDLPKIHGVIGSDLLKQYDASVNYHEGTLVFYDCE